jgi:flagellar biosynthesis component FlhA
MSENSLALINNLSGIIAAVGSLITAVASAAIIIRQGRSDRRHDERFDQLEKPDGHDIDHS